VSDRKPSEGAETGDKPQTTEEALIEARRNKARAVRERGANPFANDVNTEARFLLRDLRRRYHSASTLDEAGELKYDAEKVAQLSQDENILVLGRIQARRGFGKVSFLKLCDDGGDIQLFAKQDEMGEGFAALDDIDMADHVAVKGPVTVTKTGELSVLVKSLRLLTKALRPLPDKFKGLTDIELRYRRRYLDLIANPEVAVALRSRSLVIQGLREFLDMRGFLEVETPTLHPLIGGAAAQPFTTHHNVLDLELFLRIAPELYLKRLLVGGFERVYEIGRCYRNEGISTRHNPEFTMLEFYQAYATYETLIPMTEALLRHVDAFLSKRLAELGFGAVYEGWKTERKFTLEEPFARVPMKRAIERAAERAGLNAEEVLANLGGIGRSDDVNVEASAASLVKSWATKNERSRRVDWGNFRKALSACESQGERVFLAYEFLAEPFLTEDYLSADKSKSLPVFILDYPAETSPLARRKDNDASLTDRFELFVDGIERCNAFSELNDPEDQAARFLEQVRKKSLGQAETMDYDEDYIRALEHGMPPAAGFGLGVDRLVMMLTGQASIRDVIAFPLLRPEAKS
jgi:lysyl-tRNA synthetase class 2